MGDMGEIGEALREDRRERHAEWYRQNMATLRASGLKFAERSTSMLFREPSKPRVDFYPHTGRWRVVGKQSKTYRGGARAFLRWYARQ